MSKPRGPRKTLPKPKLRVLRGNELPPINQSEPASISVCQPPSYLFAAEKKQWRRFAPAFERVGLLTEVDESKFAMLCELLVEADELEKAIRLHGCSYETSDGILRPRPEVKMLEDDRKHIDSLLSEFGGSPAARAEIARQKALGEPE